HEGAERAELEGLLNRVSAELARLLGTHAPGPISLLPADVEASERLAVLGREKLGGAEVELEIRTLHDAVMLRLSVLRAGDFQSNDLPVFARPPLTSLEGWTTNYLGVLAT